MQEDSRTHETMESWDNITKGPRKTHTMTLQQRAVEILAPVGMLFKLSAEGSNTITTRLHLQLGQAHRARMDYQSVQRVTASQAQRPRLFTPQNAIKNLEI